MDFVIDLGVLPFDAAIPATELVREGMKDATFVKILIRRFFVKGFAEFSSTAVAINLVNFTYYDSSSINQSVFQV